jgi:hypothetical protein
VAEKGTLSGARGEEDDDEVTGADGDDGAAPRWLQRRRSLRNVFSRQPPCSAPATLRMRCRARAPPR